LGAPNGSGKSTLIKMILGIIKPDRRAVWLDRRLKLGVILEDHIALKLTPLTQLLVAKHFNSPCLSVPFNLQPYKGPR